MYFVASSMSAAKAVILPRLNEQQREIYTVMQQLKGNKPYLWEGIYNGGEDTGPSYEIPGEALDDPAFVASSFQSLFYKSRSFDNVGMHDYWQRICNYPTGPYLLRALYEQARKTKEMMINELDKIGDE